MPIMDTTDKRARLVDPGQRPESDVVIYDGHCRFCTAQVQRLASWDGQARLAFLSLHDPRTAQLCPDLTPEQLMEQLYVVTSGGQRFGGAAALRYLSRRLPRLWPLAPLMHIPFSLPLWQTLYRVVARYRYRWGRTEACETGSCNVHYR
jgi:predicted DCC family thiol-disulfide oxidoreductase YuxK